jgi:hypothetical protein
VGWLDARLPYACELLNACSGSTMILPVSCDMLAWAARRPHGARLVLLLSKNPKILMVTFRNGLSRSGAAIPNPGYSH